MRLANAFLANHAEVRDGLAYVSGAFPEWLEVEALPSAEVLYLVVVVELDQEDLGAPTEIAVSIVPPGGPSTEVVAFKSVREAMEDDPPGSPLLEIVATPLSAVFEVEGRHEYRIDFPESDLTPVGIPILVRRVESLSG